jgi:acetolactate synthase regulatory subunit
MPCPLGIDLLLQEPVLFPCILTAAYKSLCSFHVFSLPLTRAFALSMYSHCRLVCSVMASKHISGSSRSSLEILASSLQPVTIVTEQCQRRLVSCRHVDVLLCCHDNCHNCFRVATVMICQVSTEYQVASAVLRLPHVRTPPQESPSECRLPRLQCMPPSQMT